MLSEKQYTFLMSLVRQQLRTISKLSVEDLLEANGALYEAASNKNDPDNGPLKRVILAWDQRVLLILRGMEREQPHPIPDDKE